MAAAHAPAYRRHAMDLDATEVDPSIIESSMGGSSDNGSGTEKEMSSTGSKYLLLDFTFRFERNK